MISLRWPAFAMILVAGATSLVGMPASDASPVGSAATAPAIAPASNRVNAAYSVRLGDSVTIPSESKTHVGDVVVTQGSVSEYSGAKVGTFTLSEQVVDPKYSGANEARIAKAALSVGGSVLFGETLVIAKHGDQSPAGWYMSVVGGIGAYRSATGNMTLMYVKGMGWRLSFDVTLESTPLRQGLSVARLESRDVASGRPGGLGSATATVGVIQGGGQLFETAVTLARGESTSTRLHEVSLSLPKGTVLLRGLVAEARAGRAKPTSFAILGGTGDYLGVRGDARIVPESATRSKISLTFTRLRDGRPESPVVTATQTREADVGVFGAVVYAQIGTLNGKDDDRRSLTGTYSRLVTEWLPVGDVAIATVAARYELSGGSLIVGGVGVVGEQIELVILGGTSEYAGSRGTITVTTVRRGVTRLDLILWRGGVGPVG